LPGLFYGHFKVFVGQIGGLDGSFWAILGCEKQPPPNICGVGVALAAVAAVLCRCGGCGGCALQLWRLSFAAVAAVLCSCGGCALELWRLWDLP